MAESHFLPADVIARIKHNPDARRAFWKHSYDQSAQTESDFVFMNLGYADQVVGPEDLAPFDLEACPKNLYRRSERELTAQVLNARALVSQHPVSREALEKVPEENRPALREAFFLQGAQSYRGLQARTTRYGSWLVQRRLTV